MIDRATRNKLHELRDKRRAIDASIKRPEKRKPAAFGRALTLCGSPAERRKASLDYSVSLDVEAQLLGKTRRQGKR